MKLTYLVLGVASAVTTSSAQMEQDLNTPKVFGNIKVHIENIDEQVSGDVEAWLGVESKPRPKPDNPNSKPQPDHPETVTTNAAPTEVTTTKVGASEEVNAIGSTEVVPARHRTPGVTNRPSRTDGLRGAATDRDVTREHGAERTMPHDGRTTRQPRLNNGRGDITEDHIGHQQRTRRGDTRTDRVWRTTAKGSEGDVATKRPQTRREQTGRWDTRTERPRHTTPRSGGRGRGARTTLRGSNRGYEQYFDVNRVSTCTKGDQDEDTGHWSNVVYADDRSYYKHAAGFEPASESDCYSACAVTEGCKFFWFEDSLPDDELTHSGRYCSLYASCDETRTLGWPGTTFILTE